MRKKNAALGSLLGILYQILSVALSFVSRTIFLKVLNEEYLGINTVLADIFGVLVALDFGLSSSLFLKIYKPLSEGNENKIGSVYSLIRLVYRIRGIVVLIVGSILFFFLPKLVTNTTLPIRYIEKCYCIYMVFNVISYWVIFYNFFLEAAQKRYVLSVVQAVVTIVTTIINIVTLLIFKSFIIYMITSLALSGCVGIISKYIGYHYYPFLRKKHKINKEELKDLKEMLGMGFHSMSGVVVNSTDSLLITSLVGLGMNGLYSNYKMLIDKISGLVAQVTGSIKDPLRDLMASESNDYVKNMTDKVNFFCFWVSGFCATCIVNLVNPFIEIIWGKYYLLEMSTVVLAVTIMYLPILNYTTNDIYYYTRCYVRDKKTPLIEVTINLVASIIFGRIMGLNGILVGTVLCYVFQAIRRGYRVYKLYFNESVWEYIADWLKYNVMIAVSVALTFFITENISLSSKVGLFIIKMIICLILPNILYLFTYHKSESYQYFRAMITSAVVRVKRK